MKFIITLAFLLSAHLVSVNAVPNPDTDSNRIPDRRFRVLSGDDGIPENWLRFRRQLYPRCSSTTCDNNPGGSQCCEGYGDIQCRYSSDYCPIVSLPYPLSVNWPHDYPSIFHTFTCADSPGCSNVTPNMCENVVLVQVQCPAACKICEPGRMCIPGSRIPSPYDRCNTCLCDANGKIGGCTRAWC